MKTQPYILVAGMLLAAAGTALGQTDPTFTRITQGPLVTDGMDDHAVAWGDYNGDGYLDVVTTGGYWASGAAYSSLLYTNRRDGSFARAIPNPFSTSANAMCVNWADADNDGDLDFWLGVNEASAPQYFTNRGNGTFNRMLPNATWIENGGSLRGCMQAWADYDGDGLVDLIVVPHGDSSATAGPVSLLHNLGNGRFAVITNSLVHQIRAFSSLVSWVDFDNDGDPDLLRGNVPPGAFRNDGGTLVPWPDGDTPFVVGNANMDAWGDYDNDGSLEVLVAQGRGTPQLWRKNYPTGWTLLDGPLYQALQNVSTSTEGNGVAWGDYDNDGDLDLFLAIGDVEYQGNRNHLFRNDGTAGFVEVLTGSPVTDWARSYRCVWVDYDNDGFLDLHVVNSGGQNDFLYHNGGNSNGWLEVKLTGQLSNRSAIGAKVRVKANIGGKEVWQLRTISAQGFCQELVAHFGLGDADHAEVVRIEWPSGIRQELISVATRQILSINEEVLAISSSVSESKPGVVEVLKGEAVTLNMSSVPPGATLQWQFNGQDIEGATTASLVIPTVSATDLGSYSVLVTTTDLRVSSRPIAVRMQGGPVIVSGPWAVTPQSISVGAPVVLRAVIEGTPSPACQWQLDGVDIPAAANATATTTELRINSATIADSGDYRLVVSNAVNTVFSATLSIHVDASFVKIKGQPIVEDREPSLYGLWCDYDNDGFLDLFVANSTYSSPAPRNTLYHNEGGGAFTRVTNAVTSIVINTLGGAWGDYDNDGAADLFFIPYNGTLSLLFHNDRDGAFTRNLAAPFLGSWQVTGAWADLEGDGWLDLLICTYDGNQADMAFRNLGNGTFQRLTVNEAGAIVADLANTFSPSFADFDNDGDADLYVTCDSRPDFLYRNLGSGLYETVQLGSVPGPSATAGGNWADFNNDGFFDLLTTGSSIPCTLYTNVEGREFTDVTHAAGLATPAGAAWGAAWGDLDNDGDLDLFIPYYWAANLFFVNNGDGTFTSSSIGSPLQEGYRDECASWADYDNDGFLDLFIACGEADPTPNLLYRNNLPLTGNTNHWLKVKLEGRASNAMGIGAKIRVRAVLRDRETWQLRQIASNGALVSGTESIAHFGLGDATNVDLLRIEWPSGIVQTVTNVAPGQMLTVTEHQDYAGPPPAFGGATKITNGIELAITEPMAGAVYTVQASTNLVSWTKLIARTSAGGTFAYKDISNASYPRRFYRVLVP